MERRQSAWGRSVVKSATSWHHLFSELRCQRRAHGEQRRSRGAEGRMRLQWVNIFVYRNWSSVPHPQTVYTHPGVCPSGEKKYTRGTDPFFCLTHFSFAVYLINFAFYPSFWLGKFFYHLRCQPHCHTPGHCGGTWEPSLSSLFLFWSIFQHRAQSPSVLPPPFLGLQGTALIQPTWPSLSSMGQIQAVVNQGREGMRDQGKTVKRNSNAVLGQGPGFPSQDTHNNTFELFCRYWNPSRWEKLTVSDGMVPTSM